MNRVARIGLFAQILFYILSGINHFWHGRFYTGIMPDHYSHRNALVQLSGLAEILGGAGLAVPASRRFSSLGLALMLIVFLDVHVFIIRHSERFPNFSLLVMWARLPLQGVLIAWALYYARNHNTKNCCEPTARLKRRVSGLGRFPTVHKFGRRREIGIRRNPHENRPFRFLLTCRAGWVKR